MPESLQFRLKGPPYFAPTLKEHRKRDGNGVARNRLDLLLSRAWPDKGRKNLIYFGRRFFSGLAESLWGYIWKGCGKCSKGLVLSLISL